MHLKFYWIECGNTHIVVTMKQKLNAIGRLDKNELVNFISEELGVGIMTVKD